MKDITTPQQLPEIDESGNARSVTQQVIADLHYAYTTTDGAETDADVLAMIGDLRDREAYGVKKYGTTLQPNNGRDALVDAYQEEIDALQYYRQYTMEHPDDLELETLYWAHVQRLWMLRKLLRDRGLVE